jgi:hypothetical protein
MIGVVALCRGIEARAVPLPVEGGRQVPAAKYHTVWYYLLSPCPMLKGEKVQNTKWMNRWQTLAADDQKAAADGSGSDGNTKNKNIEQKV